MSVFAVFVVAVLAAAAMASAVLAHRFNRCAQEAAATALRFAPKYRPGVDVDQAPPGELFHCRNCDELIEATPDGFAVPYMHVRTRIASCEGQQPGPFVTWAEPRLPERWLADVEPADLLPAASTSTLPAIVVEPEPGACRNCGMPIEESDNPAGRAHRHVGNGPACWLQNGVRIDEFAGLYAEPYPAEPIASTRPPLSAIPAPALQHSLGALGDDL